MSNLASRPATNQRIILLVGGAPAASAKTAINLIRYRREEIVAVWDPAHPGETSESLFGLGGPIPLVGRLEDAPHATTLIVGIAPAGGQFPPAMRQVILEGIARGMNVVSGLHEFLSEDAEVAAAARSHGVSVTDIRKNTERDVSHRQGLRAECLRIHTVGQDCNVGKMVVSVELTAALRRAGHDAKFVATGQTGIMIEGDGCPIDAVVVDFVNGAAEKQVLANQQHEILLIEGQGSIVHPRYSAVTLGLLHGCAPDGLILCYESGRSHIAGMEHVPLTPLHRLKFLYETMASEIHPCRVIGVGMNSRRLSESEATAEQKRVEDELQLPVCDVLRHGPERLVNAVLALKSGRTFGVLR